jgi:hypothetical protein
MATYAILNLSGVVLNTIVWDGVEPYEPLAGCTTTRIDTVTPLPGIGWTLIGSTWTAPAPPAPPPDPQGFTAAILASAATNAEKGYLLTALPAFIDELELADSSIIEAGWQAIENSGQLSSSTITLAKALAVTYAIPIS